MGVLVLAAGSPLGTPVHGRPLNAADKSADLDRHDAAERVLGHRFTRGALLREAMTHRSAACKLPGRRRGSGSNERLEFIGDRVLGLIVAEWLIERFPDEQEGELGRRLAQLVSQPALAEVADRMQLTDMLSIAPGEERAGVRNRATVVADAVEAAIGALYLDGGLAAAQHFVRRAWEPLLHAQQEPPKDAKTSLQEWAQARGRALPRYEVAARAGPSHAPVFTIHVQLDGPPTATRQGVGIASSKREAEQAAASNLLAQLGAAPRSPA